MFLIEQDVTRIKNNNPGATVIKIPTFTLRYIALSLITHNFKPTTSASAICNQKISFATSPVLIVQSTLMIPSIFYWGISFVRRNFLFNEIRAVLSSEWISQL